MRKSVLLLLFLFILMRSFSQNDSTELRKLDIEILKPHNFEYGIYKNFKEFQDNNPSFKTDFMLKDRFQLFTASKPHVLVFYDETTDTYKKYKEENWGFCSGRKIYVQFKKKYLELSIVGKYSFFMTYGHSEFGTYDINYVLNLETNEKIYLTKENLIKLLEIEDTKLLEEFKKEKKKKEKLKDYIGKINDLYK